MKTASNIEQENFCTNFDNLQMNFIDVCLWHVLLRVLLLLCWSIQIERVLMNDNDLPRSVDQIFCSQFAL